MRLTQEIIAAKRDGAELSEADIRQLIAGLPDGSVSEGQAAAFAMGVCRGGFSEAETVALTRAMRDSGEVLHWDLPGPVLDKHSTGGLGDSTSLIVAPILAALGCYAPVTCFLNCTIRENSCESRLAPPTRAPSMFAWRRKPATFWLVTEPP